MKTNKKLASKNEKTKEMIYFLLGTLGILLFILQIFVFESPDGFFGYLVCLFSTLLTILSFIKLYKISKTFRSYLKALLEWL